MTTDAAKLPVMLTTLRLPTIGRLWQEFGARADREGWGAPASSPPCASTNWPSGTRRIARHLAEAGLPPGKTLATFDFAAVPTIRKAHVLALAEGDAWIEQGANILIFGPSGTGKTHLAAAIGAALIDNGYRVLFTRTTDLVQKLQAARRDLSLPATLAKLDKLRLPDPRRSRLRPQGSGRDERPVRADRRALRAPLAGHHLQSALQRMGPDLPRSRRDGRGDRPPRPPRHDPGAQHRELSSPRGRSRWPARATPR